MYFSLKVTERVSTNDTKYVLPVLVFRIGHIRPFILTSEQKEEYNMNGKH